MKRLFQNPLTYCVLFIAAIACAERCYADVTVCPDQSALGKLACNVPMLASKQPSKMVGTDLVNWCVDSPSADFRSCSSAQWRPWSYMASYSWVLTKDGWKRYSDLKDDAVAPLVVTSYTISPLTCYDARNRHWKIDSSLRVLVVAWCRYPDHIHRSARLYKPFTLANAQEINSDGDTAEAKRLDAKYTNQALSAADEAYVLAWAKPYEPILVVAKNGTSKTRPVYPRNADGTQGTKSVGTVLVGTPCDYRSSIKDADYFAVPGGFALCTVANFVK